MDIGFETIGNASLICHDRGPVLATDPWLEGSAYFGSWCLSHEIPAEQRAHIQACKYLWISHGHPDHLSPASLEKLRDKEILLPDHYGGRIRRELDAQGYRVRELRSGEWVELSPRLRVLSIADVFQDAVLLIDLGGHLVVDSNDCGDHGGGDFLRKLTPRYASSFLCCLTGYGDADMIHFFDEQGRRVLPAAARKEPPGPGIHGLLSYYGIKRYCPSSTMHKYQRADSVWANEYTTPIEDFARDFPAGERECLPAFIAYDLARMSCERIAPRETPDRALAPEEFGDRWSDPLEPADLRKARDYFAPIAHLQRFLGWINFRVGGRDNYVDIARDRFQLGISFEAPRASLMSCIEWRTFDDLLIGNYARTTLHGPWRSQGADALYPDFSPFVGKFADNGDARSPEELGRYFQSYRERGVLGPSPAPGVAELLRVVESYAPA